MTTTNADELLKGCGAMNVCGNGQYCKYCKRVIAQSLAEKKEFLEYLDEWEDMNKCKELQKEIKKLEEAGK